MDKYINKIIQGDCLEKLKELPDNSVDSICTDPPYELGFMGKSWDSTGVANNVEMWGECLRVLKPGGHLLAFSGTRTYHRMAVAIEDAGFEVRDMIEWVYGSGFPKSLNISKAIEATEKYGKSGTRTLRQIEQDGEGETYELKGKNNGIMGETRIYQRKEYNPTGKAKEWKGWGTALKPSHEPVIVSMKPLQVEQIFAILIDNIWNNLPVSDVMQNLRDTQAKLNEVVSTVPVNVRTNFLENIDNVEFVETLTTSLAIKSKKEKENSAQENVAQSGEKLSQEIKIPTGEVEGVSLADISTSVQMGDISENTVLLWKNISEELLNQTNTLTIRTAIKKIIELKTLRSCLIQNIGINTGRSTNIPPNHEPICMARKPLEAKTVAENCLKWGTGGINIDESRVGTEGGGTHCDNRDADGNCLGHNNAGKSTSGETIHAKETGNERTGRFPANLILSDCEEVRECFPETGKTGSGKEYKKEYDSTNSWKNTSKEINVTSFADSGNASRFFKSIIYQAKASKSERNRGCDGLEEKPKVFNGQSDKPSTDMKDVEKRFTTMPKANNHPTVKPLKLMEYLIKMVTKPGGIVLDPFAGSGSTLVAAKQNGFKYIGIELTEEYIPIIEARLNYTNPHFTFL